MKKIVFLLILISISEIEAQGLYHNANILIIVDNEVFPGSVSNVWLLVGDKKIEVDYVSGNLKIDQKTHSNLKMTKVNPILRFDYYQYVGERQKIYNYELPFSEDWLDMDYLIIRIYNLDKRKFRKAFEPLDKNKNYTFEFDYPGGSTRRLKR